MTEPTSKKQSSMTGIVSWLKHLFSTKKISGWFSRNSKRRWVDYVFLIAFLVLILVAASMSDVFFTQRNISNLLRQIVTNGLISLGMLVVILTGGIDLSVGPIVAFSAIVVAGMIQDQGLPLPCHRDILAVGSLRLVQRSAILFKPNLHRHTGFLSAVLTYFFRDAHHPQIRHFERYSEANLCPFTSVQSCWRFLWHSFSTGQPLPGNRGGWIMKMPVNRYCSWTHSWLIHLGFMCC
jgi:hypothetical protein